MTTQQTLQLELWEEPVRQVSVPAPERSILEHISWSYSRRGLLEQCPRRYYYQYYGASKWLSDDDGQRSLLRFLKRMPNRFERTGEILHLVIASFLRNVQKGEERTADSLIQWAQRIFKDDIDYSSRDPEGLNNPGGRYPPVLLREFHYQMPNAREECETALERLLNSVATFANSPVYAEYRELANRSGVLIEKWIAVSGLPCKVRGRADLVLFEPGAATVLDWKLGSGAGGDDSLQLVSYALWACDQFGLEAQEVRLLKALLGTEDLVGAQLTDATLARGRGRIIQDAELMAVADRYGKNGQVEAFSACAQPAVCRLCPFLKACSEGRDCVEVGD